MGRDIDKRVNRIICADASKVLRQFPSEFIDCVITSPPYWATRDYGVDEQIGLEEHPQRYIDKIVDVMKELKRVIKSTGTIFLNLGDSYYTKSGSGQGSNFLKRHKQLDGGKGVLHKAHTKTRGKFKSNWLQSKQKLLIPYRIAIKCQDELALILRNDINWIKQWVNFKNKESAGSSMPTSVQDRLNTNSEVIFFFVKQRKYFFNLNAIRIPHKQSTFDRAKYGFNRLEGDKHYSMKSTGANKFAENLFNGKLKGKNPGDCIFNPNAKLQEEDKNKIVGNKGLYEETNHTGPRFYHSDGKNPGNCVMFPFEPSKGKHFAIFPSTLPEFCILAGCPENGIVLDPFCGSGTTLLVAKKLGRNYIGIDLNSDYVKMAKERINDHLVVHNVKKQKGKR